MITQPAVAHNGQQVTRANGRTIDHLNMGCGTHYAPEPWLNVDVHADEATHPDLLTKPARPFPFPTCSVQRVFCGHVLEHLPLADVPFFLKEAHRVLIPGGQLLACGPDVHKTLTAWKAEQVSLELMHSVLEHAAYPYPTPEWPGALHQWNCNQQRVEHALTVAGFAWEALDVPPAEWPTVGFEPLWQFCLLATKNGTP